MTLVAAPKIARMLPRLASEHDGEVLATVRAIGRTLAASGSDWHELAAELQNPAPALPQPERRRRPRARTSHATTAPFSAEALRLLRAGMDLDAFSAWERSFASTVVQAAGRPSWRPSKKQVDVAARLVRKAAEAEQHR